LGWSVTGAISSEGSSKTGVEQRVSFISQKRNLVRMREVLIAGGVFLAVRVIFPLFSKGKHLEN